MKCILAIFLALSPAAALAWPSNAWPLGTSSAAWRSTCHCRGKRWHIDGLRLAGGRRRQSWAGGHELARRPRCDWSDHVVFPDGFRSGALILRVDRDWDLAALAIQKPKVQPIRVATETPRPGEPLTIAGYGPEGDHRAVGGKCTEYLSPGKNLPAELVEVDVQARRGDSGGPIYNSRGEIAGVLFGAGGNFLTGGYTMGSYCGRVRQFLAASYVTFQQLPGIRERGARSKEQEAGTRP